MPEGRFGRGYLKLTKVAGKTYTNDVPFVRTLAGPLNEYSEFQRRR